MGASRCFHPSGSRGVNHRVNHGTVRSELSFNGLSLNPFPCCCWIASVTDVAPNVASRGPQCLHLRAQNLSHSTCFSHEALCLLPSIWLNSPCQSMSIHLSSLLETQLQSLQFLFESPCQARPRMTLPLSTRPATILKRT